MTTIRTAVRARLGDPRTEGGARAWQRVIASAALALCLVAAVCGGTALLLGSGNQALSDGATTKTLIDDVRTPLAQVLTYEYGDMHSTRQAADRLFAGAALRQYRGMYQRLEAQAVREHTVVTSIVRQLGVVSLHGDQAQLLAFVDQQVLAGKQQKRSGSAQLELHAQRRGGSWKVTQLKLL